MNKNVRYLFRNVSYTIFSNGINLAMSILVAFIVPKLFGVREYSYWQLYSFYASYVGFFHFGWADGIYLRFGGEQYEHLNHSYFSTQFWLLVFLEIIIALSIGFISFFMISDPNKKYILIITGICCIVQIPRTLLQYLLQTTNRIVSFAKNAIWEKVIYATLVFFILVCGVRYYKPLLLADLFARMCTLGMLCYTCRDIVFSPITNIIAGIKEAWINMTVGMKLMFGNIASMLITGIMRFSIEQNWDIETFGKVSLTMAVSNMLMVFVSAVGIVIYPLIKHISKEQMADIYGQMRTLLMVVVLGLMCFYYPGKIFLSNWLPQYAESLNYMALLFPICVFESKMSMLINTYLKALRKERIIFGVNWITVLLSCLFAIIFAYVLKSLTLSILSITLLSGVKCILMENMLARHLKITIYSDVVQEMLLVIVFVFSGWLIQSWYCLIIYSIFYFFYLLLHKNTIRAFLNKYIN